jgi:DNA-binding SARP family transcriptional activator
VRPHLLDRGTAQLLDELVASPEVHKKEETDITIVAADDQVRDDSLEPGLLEVKLLGPTPHLIGLQAELPANRARRAVELVAYLALHRPDEITSDRLRTRVLGSSDADAASKTLFNVAAAARRAMGADRHGQPLFPSGTRTGLYRVSSSVTVDVLRACNLATYGSSCEDPDTAMAFLRAALELIEGEPLANALSGYTWWEAEGHGARLAAVMVNGACNLAALAADAGHFELAQWGLSQARLVDPFSEALSRAAMQVAAAAGDADRLRREWRECQRRVDELDPGSSPSPRTERLYGELSQHVLVGAARHTEEATA